MDKPIPEAVLEASCLCTDGWCEGCRELITAINTLTAAQQQGQAVAWVPVHPRQGPLWAMATDKPDRERLPSYPLRPLIYGDTAAPPSAPVGVEWPTADVSPEHSHIPCAKYPDLLEYHLAVAGEGDHAYTWSDKPHRLVYGLTSEATHLRDCITAVAQQPAAVDGANRSRRMQKLWLDEWLSDYDVEMTSDAYAELLDAIATQHQGPTT